MSRSSDSSRFWIRAVCADYKRQHDTLIIIVAYTFTSTVSAQYSLGVCASSSPCNTTTKIPFPVLILTRVIPRSYRRVDCALMSVHPPCCGRDTFVFFAPYFFHWSVCEGSPLRTNRSSTFLSKVGLYGIFLINRLRGALSRKDWSKRVA